jgi:hypothetical protein
MPRLIEGGLAVSTELGTEYVPTDAVSRDDELNDFVQGEDIFDVVECQTNWMVYNGSRWLSFSCVTTAREYAEGLIA